MDSATLRQLQALPLEIKVAKTKLRIREWYEAAGGDVYVSFSGGKDSTVLLHIVRSIYPKVPAVFIDTGLEYPEIREFVKQFDNVKWLKPRMSFLKVIRKYGYPVVSKEQAGYIYDYRHSKSERVRHRAWYGDHKGRYKIYEKWKFLVEAPFEISPKCCDVMKKWPANDYYRETGRVSITGSKAADSLQRKASYLKHGGCNGYDMTRPRSMPLGFWTDQDVLMYLKETGIPYCPVYGDIVEEDGKLATTGVESTGCMFCMFGVHLERPPNRFQQMKLTHPQLYNYCINVLGIGEVLDYMGLPYK